MPSFWEALTGSSAHKTASTSSPASSSATATAEPTFHDTGVPDAAPDVASFMYGQNFDPSRLHPMAGLDNETLEYLQLEDSALNTLPGAQSAIPSRGWSDDLCYGTGVTYLSALTLGGTWGLIEGLNKTSGTMSGRLRLNGILNAVTRRGPFLGNNAGVLAMVYNGINSTVGHLRGKHDAANSVLSGALAGAMWKSTRGTRPMLIASGLTAGVAGGWALLRKSFSSIEKASTPVPGRRRHH